MVQRYFPRMQGSILQAPCFRWSAGKHMSMKKPTPCFLCGANVQNDQGGFAIMPAAFIGDNISIIQHLSGIICARCFEKFNLLIGDKVAALRIDERKN
jgi:hypothetical protein